VRESESQNTNRTISLVIFAKISIYSLKMFGWNESGTIWMKNIYGTKLREALPNRRQICSKYKIWKMIFEDLNR
jgi:hypothetical protein